jgi:hypothetical protein
MDDVGNGLQCDSTPMDPVGANYIIYPVYPKIYIASFSLQNLLQNKNIAIFEFTNMFCQNSKQTITSYFVKTQVTGVNVL